MKEKWVFYYEKSDGTQWFFDKYKCIKPSKTKIWKVLEKLATDSSNDIKSWGYTSNKHTVKNTPIDILPVDKNLWLQAWKMGCTHQR